jgi:hypothetical protein
MVTTQRPSTARRAPRPSGSAATTSRGTARKPSTAAARGSRTTAAESPRRRQTQATAATTKATRRRTPHAPAVKESVAPATAQAQATDGGVVRWTAFSVPVLHARVPVPTIHMSALPSPVPGVTAVAARARWATQAAQANLPPADRLLYYGGVGALALGGVLEWPVALIAGAGVWVASRAAERQRGQTVPGVTTAEGRS